MSKKKPMDKAEARERRNRMLESAAAARLSLTEGVREMRAIAGMTQEEFARHRGVSARVIKAIELGQGNPTVATMNRIGQFFGLEVAFVPIKRNLQTGGQPQSADSSITADNGNVNFSEVIRNAIERRKQLFEYVHAINQKAAVLDEELNTLMRQYETLTGSSGPALASAQITQNVPEDTPLNEAHTRKKRKPRSP